MAKNSLAKFYQQPSNFLYIFATDAFISKLGSKAAYVISAKKANQKKLLNTTAVDEGVTYETAYNNVASAFKEFYGVTPQQALVTLAEGGEVAGKNWAKGVYGVGKLNNSSNTFHDTPGASALIEVDPSNGLMFDMDDAGNKNGYYESLGCTTVSLGKDGNPNCYKYIDANGNTYTSVRNERTGKWSAGHYDNSATGVSYNAFGKEVTAADMSSVWESLTLSFQKLVEWLVSLFNSQNDTNKQLINASNTQPSQMDGWVSEAGVAPWILFAVAAGVLFTSGGLGAFWRNARKGKRKK